MKMANVIVLGGCGYKGSILCPQLKKAGHNVISYDIEYFGNFNPDIHNYRADIRNYKYLTHVCRIHEIDTVINLSCISNDPSAELNPELTKSINFEAFEPMIATFKAVGVKRIIHASSGSVYGISDQINITEDHPLVPVSLYNEYKAAVEPILLRYLDGNFQGVIIRPGTICGYSPRLRLDLTVNALTKDAYFNQKINVFGGEQMRPNLHIKDICDLYQLLVELPQEKFPNGEIFNAGAANYTVKAIANIVKYNIKKFCRDIDKVKIKTTKSNDPRSYHIDSSKMEQQLGFIPRRNVSDAVMDLCDKFSEGLIKNPNDSIFYNVKHLKKKGYNDTNKKILPQDKD
jgi:nucleoside-diphosphate-sugar epimerase